MRVTADSMAKNYNELINNIVVKPQLKSSNIDSSNIIENQSITDNIQSTDMQSAYTQSNDIQSNDIQSNSNNTQSNNMPLNNYKEDLFVVSKTNFMQTYYDTIAYMQTHYSLKSKKDTKDFWHKFYATNYSAAQYIYNKFYLLADTENDSKSDSKLNINTDQVYDMLSVFILPRNKFVKYMIKLINIDAINELINFLEVKIKDNTVICFEAMHKACIWFLKSLLDMKAQYYYLQQIAHTRGILYGLFEKANWHLAISQHMWQQIYSNYYITE